MFVLFAQQIDVTIAINLTCLTGLISTYLCVGIGNRHNRITCTLLQLHFLGEAPSFEEQSCIPNRPWDHFQDRTFELSLGSLSLN